MRRFILISSIFIIAGLSLAGLLLINKVDAQQKTPVPVPSSKTTVSTNTTAIDVTTVSLDNWSLSCRAIAGESDKKQCSAVNRITDQKTGQVLFVWLIGHNTERKLVSAFQTPTGVMIAPGIHLELSNGQKQKIDFLACDNRRCDASLVMDQAFVDDLKVTKEATAAITSVTGHNILFKINTTGIDKVLSAFD